MNGPRPTRPRREDALARLASRGVSLPRWARVLGLAWLVVMTVWGFVRSLT